MSIALATVLAGCGDSQESAVQQLQQKKGEFTPEGFKTPTLPEGAAHKGYDICGLVATAGASYVSRITGIGDISDQLAEAFSRDGFSLVEVMEICTSYGVKSNPGMKLKSLIQEAGIEIKVYADDQAKTYETNEKEDQHVTYVELLPIDATNQSPQHLEKISERTRMLSTYYKTNNPDLFWKIPE